MVPRTNARRNRPCGAIWRRSERGPRSHATAGSARRGRSQPTSIAHHKTARHARDAGDIGRRRGDDGAGNANSRPALRCVTPCVAAGLYNRHAGGSRQHRRNRAHSAAARRHFYRLLLQIGGNRELQRLFPAIGMHIIYAQYQSRKLRGIRLADYRDIIDAVAANDLAAAETAGRTHVDNVRRVIEQIHAPAAPDDK